MANSTDPFIAYANALIHLGHDPNWLRHHESAMRERFARDPRPFPPPAPPRERPRDRYGEL